jgi:hypothetical protein
LPLGDREDLHALEKELEAMLIENKKVDKKVSSNYVHFIKNLPIHIKGIKIYFQKHVQKCYYFKIIFLK